MQRFPLNWYLSEDYPWCVVDDDDDFYEAKLELNEEWTLRCLLTIDFSRSSVELHRKVITGTYSVRGELQFKIERFQSKEKKFSLLIKPGTRFENICSFHLNPVKFGPCNLQGFVTVECTDGKFDAHLPDEERKKCVQTASLKELSSNFERLLDPETACFADGTLKCSDAVIPAHRNVLSARSPVFAAMFASPMKENFRKEVDIPDVDAPVLRVLLTYVYTGKCSDLTTELASALLYAADKYQLPDLKRVCSYFLEANVSPENVLKILVLGDLYDEDLKSFAVDYICNKCPEFSVMEETEEWKTLKRDRAALALDVLSCIVKSRDEKLKKNLRYL